ncbi:MAG: extracellular solute-binding protein [Alphaproteobacteria bacterium]|nr:extracellular solute-binding protein [Alphaproteobacteria bacterium]
MRPISRRSTLVATAALAGAAMSGPASAQADRDLVVYASHPSEMVDYFTKAFSEKHGVKVTTVKAGTGELLNRIRAERARPGADVLWGGFADTGASAPDLFEQYRSKELANIEPKMIDAAGYNTPFGASTMVIMYNKAQVKPEDAPKTWADLAKPQWARKVVHADPSKSSSAYSALVTWLSIYGKDDKGWAMVEQLTKNMNLVIRSSLVFQQVGRGEYPIGVTYEEGAFNYVLAGTAGIVYPEDGTLLEAEGMFIVKGAKNPGAARLFADYLLSHEAQSDLATKFPGRRPTRKGVGTHPEMRNADKLKVIEYDSKWGAESRKDILDRMQKIIVKTQG